MTTQTSTTDTSPLPLPLPLTLPIKPPIPQPVVLVVMGVSGCGKTTVAALLAGRLGWPFEEGDALHPPANIEKIRPGIR